MKLEELARQSSDAARVSVAHLDPPDIGGTEPNRSWIPALAGVGVVALVAGGLYLIVRDRDDASSPADQVLPTVVEVPRLGLGNPDGWTPNMAGSFAELDGDPLGGPTFTYYGDASSDDPFTSGDLLVAAFVGADPGAEPTATPGAETVEVRGVTATVTSGADEGLPADATALEWYEIGADGTAAQIVVASRSFGTDELIRIAEGLTIDAVTRAVTPADDLGLDRLSASAATPFGAYRGSSDGYLVVYESTDGTDALMLSATRGDLEQEVAVLRWWTADVRPTTVADRPGFVLGIDDPMMGRTLIWSPSDGIVAHLAHLGTAADVDLEALARNVVELDDAAWESYRQASQASLAGADEFDEIYGQRNGSVGGVEYTWVLGTQGSDLCFNIQAGNGGTGSCLERAAVAPPSGTALTIDNSFAETYATVVIAADRSVDQVVEPSGAWTIERVDADGLAWFVAIGDPAVQPSFDVIVDGEVVATLGAAVEAVAEVAPALEENEAAIEAGVERMEIVMSSSTDSGVDWWLGRMGDDLCLVTSGTTTSAHCAPAADVTVFPPVDASPVALTHVVLRDLPPCTDRFELDGTTTEVVASGGDELHRYDVVVGTGTSDGWQLRLESAGGQTSVELPEGDGTTSWPPFVCEG